MKRLSNGIVLNRELQRNNLPDCAADTPGRVLAITDHRNPTEGSSDPFAQKSRRFVRFTLQYRGSC